MLAIIDLQEIYRTDLELQKSQFQIFLQHLKSRVSQAYQVRELVICVANEHDGRLIPEVRKLLRREDRIPLQKDDFDGSTEIDSYIKRVLFYKPKIELCGLFANICVLRTFKGLKNLGYEVIPCNKNLLIHFPFEKEEVDYGNNFLRES
jgi:nicotinamidase-related amidase